MLQYPWGDPQESQSSWSTSPSIWLAGKVATILGKPMIFSFEAEWNPCLPGFTPLSFCPKKRRCFWESNPLRRTGLVKSLVSLFHPLSESPQPGVTKEQPIAETKPMNHYQILNPCSFPPWILWRWLLHKRLLLQSGLSLVHKRKPRVLWWFWGSNDGFDQLGRLSLFMVKISGSTDGLCFHLQMNFIRVILDSAIFDSSFYT